MTNLKPQKNAELEPIDFSKMGPACQEAMEYGVDLSLLWENLHLSVEERCQRHDDALNAMLALRKALQESQDDAEDSGTAEETTKI